MKEDGEGILCEGDCGRWFDPRCVKVSEHEYQVLSQSDDSWSCSLCSTFLLRSSSVQTESRKQRKETSKQPSPQPVESSAVLQQLARMEKVIKKLSSEIEVIKSEMKDQTVIQKNREKVMQQTIKEQANQILLLEEKLSEMEERSIAPPSQDGTELDQTTKSEEERQKLYSKAAANVPEYIHKTLESHERELRKCNVIIVGIEEGDESPREAVESLCENKLQIEMPTITVVRRVGKERSTGKPRPLQVKFANQHEKYKFTAKRTALAGSKIYINNDLTPQQQEDARRLRAAFREAKENGTPAKWKQGKLFVNNSLYQLPPTRNKHSIASQQGDLLQA